MFQASARTTKNRHASHVEQHSLPHSVALHLYPGVVILGLYLVAAPRLDALGYPPLTALLIAAIVGVGVLQSAHLLLVWRARRREGSATATPILNWPTPAPLWHYIAIPLGLVVVAFVVLALSGTLDQLMVSVMPWLPHWFNFGDPQLYAKYSTEAIRQTLGLRLLVDGLLLPPIEEFYFRGYLMPRISRYGRWTPVLHHALFTVYHFWQPFNYPTILLGILPLTYVVWRTGDVRYGIVTHILVNLIGGLSTYGLLLPS